MRKSLPANLSLLLTLSALVSFTKGYSQTVAITANQGQSSTIVVGASNYHVSESIYTEPEIGAGSFTTPASAINHIDFNLFSAGTDPVVTNYNVYLKEVSSATTTFTTGVYSTAGYTLVFSGTFNAATPGWVGVDLSNTFIRTEGNNLQLLIERMDGVAHGTFTFNATRGNHTSPAVNSSRRINTNTLPVAGTTSLTTVTTFRPQVRLRHIAPNDAAIAQVYTVGKLPIPFATPHIISANVTNNGSNAQTNLNVSLNISGANNFSDIQLIPSLAAGASINVSFAPYTPAVTGISNVTVSLPADDFAGDNSATVMQEATNNAYSYAYSTIPTGSTGFNIIAGTNATGTGDMVAKFISSIPTSVNQVGVNFIAGGQPFKIGIWDKSGNGIPGNLLWESELQTSTAGVFTLPVLPAVAITDTFYIGVKQLNSTNIQFAYQNENPSRPGTFYYTNVTGSNAWTDFSPANPFRFMIEPRFTLANDVGIGNINNPASNASVDNCGITPQATVVNFGSSSQLTPFDVTFKITQSGTTVYTNTRQVRLNAGETKTIDFSPFTGAVSGNDSSTVYTSLLTDEATNNDTVVNKFVTNSSSYALASELSGGYEFANSTDCAFPSGMQQAYDWISETGNEINWAANGDDSILATPVDLPFNFYFMGAAYNQFWISSNGWISFTNPASLTKVQQRTPVTIPAAGGINNYIAGALTNLDFTPANYPDAHTFYGVTAARAFVTFEHAHLFGSSDKYISFQIILNAADSSITVQYNDTATSAPIPSAITNFCTAGIENADGTKGIRYRFNGSGGALFGSPLAVKFRPVAIVPVTLVDFAVQKNNRVNKINWVTSQEISSRTFIVERSADGRNYISIGEVAAAGNTNATRNYSFFDNAPLTGINYYRLAMVDINNLVKYSPVKSVTNSIAAVFTFYPNPVKGKLNVLITAEKNEKIGIQVTDAGGKDIINIKYQLITGINNLSLNTDHFSRGVYYIKMVSSTGIVIKKFNKF